MVYQMSTPAVDFGYPVVPAFLTKLRLLVEDEETNDLIYWDPTGNSFHICDGNKLAKEVLPLFFKHNNLSSFIRQLNMYGFRKVNRIEPCPGMKVDAEDMEFRHPFFVRHKPHLLSKIQRRPPSSFYGGRVFTYPTMSPISHTHAQPTFVAGIQYPQRVPASTEFLRLSSAIRTLRTNQETLAQQLNLLKSENQLLYRELHDLREHYDHQSQLIQTLFSFLSAFAKDGRAQNYRFSPKRKALPFTVSSVLPTDSRSGLKLNLPKGFLLDDAPNFQPIKLSSADELHDTPLKIAKVDSSGLAAITHSNTNLRLNSAGPSTSQPTQHLPSSVLSTANELALPDAKLALTPVPNTGSAPTQFTTTAPSNSSDLIVMPLDLVDEQGTDISIDLHNIHQARPNLKRTFADTERTLASLTQNPSPLPGTLLLEKGNEPLTGSENLALDLNLSRCTTPVSLIQPDSLDIAEFFAGRDDNVSEISLEDLFLASNHEVDMASHCPAAAKSAEKASKTTESSPPSGRTSVDSQATIPLEDSGPDDTTQSLSDLQTNPPTSLSSLRRALGKPDPSLTNTDQATISLVASMTPSSTTRALNYEPSQPPKTGRSSLVVSSIQSPESAGLREESSRAVDGHELFGLPWEEQEVVIENDAHQPSEVVDQFSADLLPVNTPSIGRLRGFSTANRGSLNPISNSRNAVTKYNHIGDAIKPTEAAVPFASVTTGHSTQSSVVPTILTVSPTSQSGFHATSVPSFSRQATVGVSKYQPRVVQTVISRSLEAAPSNLGFLQTTSTGQQVLVTPITFPSHLVSLRPVAFNHSSPVSLPSPRSNPAVERKEPSTYRPIAPALKPTEVCGRTPVNK